MKSKRGTVSSNESSRQKLPSLEAVALGNNAYTTLVKFYLYRFFFVIASQSTISYKIMVDRHVSPYGCINVKARRG